MRHIQAGFGIFSYQRREKSPKIRSFIESAGLRAKGFS